MQAEEPAGKIQHTVHVLAHTLPTNMALPPITTAQLVEDITYTEGQLLHVLHCVYPATQSANVDHLHLVDNVSICHCYAPGKAPGLDQNANPEYAMLAAAATLHCLYLCEQNDDKPDCLHPHTTPLYAHADIYIAVYRFFVEPHWLSVCLLVLYAPVALAVRHFTCRLHSA